MSETMIQMRFVKRHQHFMAGDVAAFPLSAARQLHALRVAEGLAELVPTPPRAAAGSDPPDSSSPLRQPGSVVKK